MLDRSIAPSFSTDFKVALQPLEVQTLSNGIKVHSLLSSTVEVFRLEIVIPFGVIHSNDLQTGHFLSRLWALGTKDKSAFQVSEAFEKLGGFLDVSMAYQRTVLTLHGMSTYFNQYLPLVRELLEAPAFLESELDILKHQSLQNYKVNKKKTTFLANNAFKTLMYGSTNILGQTLTPQRIEETNRNNIFGVYHEEISLLDFDIYLCGSFPQDATIQLNRIFGNKKLNLTSTQSFTMPPISEASYENISLENSVQSTLIIGKRLFNRSEPKFMKYLVTNTTFGGYFGSRLMKNIREEKGLTYGISSNLTSILDDGMWAIKAELNKDSLYEAQTEIFKELEILKTVPIPAEELQTVKSYIKGSILSGTNTIFDIMDKHKAIAFESLPTDFYETMSSKIDAVTTEDVQEIANTYLKDFSTVTAG